jgi:hypothetical protein
MPIAVPLPVTDAEGDALRCELLDAPAGAVLQTEPLAFVWTPAADQLGPFYPRFTCSDANSAGPAASGSLVMKVSPADSCTQPLCDAATGCTLASLPPVEPNCCTPPTARVAEPVAGCPEGRVIFIGANRAEGFGRLQNCDLLRVYNFAQNSAVVRLHIEGRCLNIEARPLMHARMETAHRVVFDQVYRIPFNDRGDGYAQLIGAGFEVEGTRPYYDLQDAEANLTVSLIDADNIETTESLRLVLTFSPVPDLPDLGRTPTPSPELTTPSPTPAEASPTPIAAPE